MSAESYISGGRGVKLTLSGAEVKNEWSYTSTQHVALRCVQGQLYVYDMIYLLTAIGLSLGGSTHLHTNNT
jgi:hypothetical protein